ncbi:hypothetical protein DV737_g5222, partial [Chaetothyriales sp. CBS 132003]
MHYSIVTGAAVLLTLAPSALALGSAIVVNNCDFDVYYASVSQGVSAEPTLIDGSYSEEFSDENDGVSIKLALEDSLSGEVSQFEFTLFSGKTAYDLSNIDGYPFAEWGLTIVPSVANDTSNPTCLSIDCPAGESVCSAAYNAPDDVRTLVCDDDTDLVLTVCPDGSSNTTDTSTEKRSVPIHSHNRIHARHFHAGA